MAKLLSTVVLLSLSSLVAASPQSQSDLGDPRNYFLYPPRGGQSINENATVYSANINITVGRPQRQPFEWRTNYTLGLAIYLFQEGNPSEVQQKRLVSCADSASTYGQYYWDGDIGAIDLSVGDIAFLASYQCDASDNAARYPFFFSHYFNLTEPVTTTTTTSVLSSPTPGPSSTATSTSATATPTQTGSNGGGSNAAALGGGIGGGIGGALVIAAIIGAIIFLRRRKKNNTPSETALYTPMSQNLSPGHPQGGAYNQGPSPSNRQPPSELGSTTTDSNYGYYDGREYKPVQQQGRLAELGV